MKKSFKTLLASVLSLCFLVGATAVTAFAAEPQAAAPVTVDMEKSGFDDNAGDFNLSLTIDAAASGDLTIDLAPAAIELLNQYAKDNNLTKYPILPGDSNQFNVYIINNSGREYTYEQGSLKLSTLDVASSTNLSPFTGYDGQKIPFNFIGAVPASNVAIYKNLFGVSSSSKVTSDMMFGIYDYLSEKGFDGPTALTDYMLKYYSDLYKTNYASWGELVAAKPNLGDTFAQAGSNSIFEMSFAKMKAYCAQHPELAPYVYYESNVENPADNDLVKVQIKWPEQDLAAFSYNVFYQEFFSFAFGENEIAQLNPNRNTAFTRTHGVGDYLDTNSALYKQADSYFAGLENADSFVGGETLAFTFMWALDGPGIGNGYMNYAFSYQHSITLSQVNQGLPPIEEIPDEDPPLAGPEEPSATPKLPIENIEDGDVPLAPPVTGDSFMIALAAAILVAAAAGVTVTVRKRKEK